MFGEQDSIIRLPMRFLSNYSLGFTDFNFLVYGVF
jgi:hypothetical protein